MENERIYTVSGVIAKLNNYKKPFVVISDATNSCINGSRFYAKGITGEDITVHLISL